MSKYIVLLFDNDRCTHGLKLREIWTVIKDKLLEFDPELQFLHISLKGFGSSFFDEHSIPSFLKNYNKWSPMVLLIPKDLWDHAMKYLGPNNPIELKDGVHIFNGQWNSNNKIIYDGKYNHFMPDDYVAWIRDILNKVE